MWAAVWFLLKTATTVRPMTTPPLKDPTSVQWSIIDETSVHWHLLKQELGHGFSTWVLTSWHLSSISLNGRSHFFKRKVTFFTRKVKTSRLRRKLIPSFASVFSFWIRETSFKNFVWFKGGMRFFKSILVRSDAMKDIYVEFIPNPTSIWPSDQKNKWQRWTHYYRE